MPRPQCLPHFRLGRLTRKYKGNALLASGKQGVALQAANFALLNVTNVNRDDLIFGLASWAGEGDRF